MELLTLTLAFALSVALGFAGSRLVLWALFFFMMRHLATQGGIRRRLTAISSLETAVY